MKKKNNSKTIEKNSIDLFFSKSPMERSEKIFLEIGILKSLSHIFLEYFMPTKMKVKIFL